MMIFIRIVMLLVHVERSQIKGFPSPRDMRGQGSVTWLNKAPSSLPSHTPLTVLA